MSAILDTFLISLTIVLVTLQQGLVFVADQKLIGRCFKGFKCCDVTCISTKNEDGGHLIPFDQNICRNKQDIKLR